MQILGGMNANTRWDEFKNQVGWLQIPGGMITNTRWDECKYQVGWMQLPDPNGLFDKGIKVRNFFFSEEIIFDKVSFFNDSIWLTEENKENLKKFS